MSRYPLYRAALAAAVFTSVPLLRAADAASDDDDDKPAKTGVIKDAGTRKAQPEVATASDEGAQAIKRMKLPEGLEMSLWAAEPMLANPVAFNFDEKGRIFVAETYRYRSSVLDIRDYMWMLEDELANRTIEDRTRVVQKSFGDAGVKELSIEGEVVRLLEDSNGDGVADKTYVYADGFNDPLDGIASGVLARRGKVWFTNIPSVWQFTGNTKAETRTEISRGYGVRFNFTGHDLHGLIFGPDGKLYFSNGDRGATLKTKEGTTIDTADMGAVYRCNPDGSQLELVAWGLRNPQSLVFNEFGDLLTGDNDCDAGDEERLVHVVEKGDSGWRIGYQFAPLEKAGPWNSEKLWHQRHPGQASYILPPVANIEDGPSGIEYYPGTGLNPSYKGSLFITHFKGAIARSGIYTYTLKPKGASYEVDDAKPFLTNALPTDVKFGPDGRLYTSDWADGWPKSKRGRIYAISDPKFRNDPSLKETQALIGGDWTKRSNDELTKLLAHADWRVRLEAQFTFAERGAASIPLLAAVATKTDASPLARRHAIWGLGQLAALASEGKLAGGTTEALPVLRSLLRDSDAEVRAQALKVLGDQRNGGGIGSEDISAFIAALQDASNRVKFFAAQGLAKTKYTSAHPSAKAITPAVLAALKANNDEDLYVRHALVTALVSINSTAELSAAIKHESKAVRMGVLLALRRLKSQEIEKFLADSDALIAREAAIAINDEPINAALPALAALIDKPLTDEPILFRVLNAHFRLGKPENAAALAAYAVRADAPAKLRAEALAQLSLWAKPPQRDRLVGIYRPLPEKTRDRAIAVKVVEPILAKLLTPGTPSDVQTAALKSLDALEIAGAADTLYSVVGDEKQSGATRTAALNALDKSKDKRLPEAVKLASASRSSALRLAALPIASRLSPEAAGPVLENLVKHGDTAEQKAAFRALAGLKHPSADKLLNEELVALNQGKVPVAVQLELITAAGRRSDPAIKKLLADREAKITASTDPLEPYRIAVAGGDINRGKRIFDTQPAMACIRCHRVGGAGGDAGPDLADVGAKYSRDYLLEAVIKPNAKIAPGFDTIVLTLKSGGAAAGIVASENADVISLRNAEGKLVEVKKSNIAKREGAPSGMPEIYGPLLTKSQLRDVVEYLASLKEKPAQIDAAKPRALRGLPPAPKATE